MNEEESILSPELLNNLMLNKFSKKPEVADRQLYLNQLNELMNGETDFSLLPELFDAAHVKKLLELSDTRNPLVVGKKDDALSKVLDDTELFEAAEAKSGIFVSKKHLREFDYAIEKDYNSDIVNKLNDVVEFLTDLHVSPRLLGDTEYKLMIDNLNYVISKYQKENI